jgi:hypothetical protein
LEPEIIAQGSGDEIVRDVIIHDDREAEVAQKALEKPRKQGDRHRRKVQETLTFQSIRGKNS